MFTRTNVHNVARIEVSKVRTLWESGGFVRDVTVTDAAGNEFQFTVFGEKQENLFTHFAEENFTESAT